VSGRQQRRHGATRSKAKAQQVHARRRAAERYSVVLSDSVRGSIVHAIQTNRTRLVERQSLRVSIHDVTLDDGLVIRVVYDRRTKQLASVLPRPVEEVPDP
jgi:hypothetical protein